MGQYHLVVNLDRKEFLHPHPLGTGLKLIEQLGSFPGISQAMMMLMAGDNGGGGGDIEPLALVGRWAGERIAVIGDYGEARTYQVDGVDMTGEEIYAAASKSRRFRKPECMSIMDARVGETVSLEPEGEGWLIEEGIPGYLRMGEHPDDPTGLFRNLGSAEEISLPRSAFVWNIGSRDAAWTNLSFEIGHHLGQVLGGHFAGSGWRDWEMMVA